MEAAGSAVGDLKAVTSRAKRAMKVQIGRGLVIGGMGEDLTKGLGKKMEKERRKTVFFHHFSENTEI